MPAAWPSLLLHQHPAGAFGRTYRATAGEKAYRIDAENEYAAPIRQTESPTYPRPASLTRRKKAVKINGIRPNDDAPALTGGKPIRERSKDAENVRF